MKTLLIPIALALTACDNATPPPPKTDATARAPNPVFETQIQAVQKARAVEGQVMNAEAAQRKQMEQAAQQ